jgi:hypothetical protein
VERIESRFTPLNIERLGLFRLDHLHRHIKAEADAPEIRAGFGCATATLAT